MKYFPTCTRAECAALAAVLSLAAICAHGMPTPAPSPRPGNAFSCADEPWKGNDEKFVQDMLVRWRDDFAKLSVGELRVKAHEVLIGLRPPAERYEIQTNKKGSITFENTAGGLRCIIAPK